MKALSIRQPWAWLICAGHKDIENRDWPTRFRGRFYVHTGKGRYSARDFGIAFRMLRWHKKDDAKAWLIWLAFWRWYSKHPSGAIIGEADIVDCFHTTDIGHPFIKSPWFEGAYGFLLENPQLYEKPTPCKGRVGFFEPEILDITT